MTKAVNTPMMVLMIVISAAVHKVSLRACHAIGRLTCRQNSASPSRRPSCKITISGMISITSRYVRATERMPQRLQRMEEYFLVGSIVVCTLMVDKGHGCQPDTTGSH